MLQYTPVRTPFQPSARPKIWVFSHPIHGCLECLSGSPCLNLKGKDEVRGRTLTHSQASDQRGARELLFEILSSWFYHLHFLALRYRTYWTALRAMGKRWKYFKWCAELAMIIFCEYLVKTIEQIAEYTTYLHCSFFRLGAGPNIYIVMKKSYRARLTIFECGRLMATNMHASYTPVGLSTHASVCPNYWRDAPITLDRNTRAYRNSV